MSGKATPNYHVPSKMGRNPVLSPNGKYLFTQSEDGTFNRIRVLDRILNREKPYLAVGNHADGILYSSSDGQFICLPNRNGNPSLPKHPAVKPHSAFLYRTGSLLALMCAIEQGSRPGFVASDPESNLFIPTTVPNSCRCSISKARSWQNTVPFCCQGVLRAYWFTRTDERSYF